MAKGLDGRRIRLLARVVGVSAIVCVGVPGRAAAQVFDEFAIPTPGAGAVAIAAGPDGNMWFTELMANKIGRITPAGTITEFTLPSPNSRAFAITGGPDGNVWFTEEIGTAIGRITPDGSITEFTLPDYSSRKGITSGPDGNVWFTDQYAARIGRVTPQGDVTQFPVSADSFQIAAGPDGDLWFTENVGNRIGRITTAGVVTEFPLPTWRSEPAGITSGPDGNVWFTEFMGDAIGRVQPDGTITEFRVPAQGAGALDIAAGADGSLWFTEVGVNAIGRITPGGAIARFQLPSNLQGPGRIASGPDGRLWFTAGDKIGRLTPPTFSFFTVTPCRVLDTRDAAKGGPAPFGAGQHNVVTVPGKCGVPTSATSVSLNVSVAAPAADGYLRLYATGFFPPLTSAVNYSAGKTRSSNALVQLGMDGMLTVFVGQSSGTVHVILDVNGYFE
jgi:streptogramin lyase